MFWVMLFKIWCLNIIFRKFFIPVFKMQTMLFSDIFVSKLKSIGPINLTNINWISLSLSRFLFISLPPIRHPLTLTEEQKLKNCHDHVAKEKERKKNTNPKKKKKNPNPWGSLSFSCGYQFWLNDFGVILWLAK